MYLDYLLTASTSNGNTAYCWIYCNKIIPFSFQRSLFNIFSILKLNNLTPHGKERVRPLLYYKSPQSVFATPASVTIYVLETLIHETQDINY